MIFILHIKYILFFSRIFPQNIKKNILFIFQRIMNFIMLICMLTYIIKTPEFHPGFKRTEASFRTCSKIFEDRTMCPVSCVDVSLNEHGQLGILKNVTFHFQMFSINIQFLKECAFNMSIVTITGNKSEEYFNHSLLS